MPISEEAEKIVHSMLSEINDGYGLDLDCNPDSMRGTEPILEHGTAWTVTVGASHLTRISRALRDQGVRVNDICTLAGALQRKT